MADKITTLQLKADPDTKIYPNVRDENIPDTIARQSDLDEAKADIATNKANIATNATDINKNKSDIYTNKANIALNKGSISALTSSLFNKVTTKDVEADSGTIASLHATDFELGRKSDGSPLIYNDSNNLVRIDNVETDLITAKRGVIGTIEIGSYTSKSGILAVDDQALVFDKDNNQIFFTFSIGDEDAEVRIPRPVSNSLNLLTSDQLPKYSQILVHIVEDNADICFSCVSRRIPASNSISAFVEMFQGATFPCTGFYNTGTATSVDYASCFSITFSYEDTKNQYHPIAYLHAFTQKLQYNDDGHDSFELQDDVNHLNITYKIYSL